MSMTNVKGFTLVEVMVAMVVLAIGMLGVIMLQVNATGGTDLARSVTEGSDFSSRQLETLMSLPYTDPTLTDSNGDGTAGLDRPFPSLPTHMTPDFTGLAPDHKIVSPDGNYTVCWNIADNYPGPNMKTIRVIAISTGRGAQKVVHFDFIKAAAI